MAEAAKPAANAGPPICETDPADEAKALLVIALPLIFAYLADVLMVVTAKMVVGRLGALELAAAGISTDLSYQMCIVLMGFFSVVGVLVSEALGAAREADALPELIRGLILSGILGRHRRRLSCSTSVIVLNAAGQDAEVIRMSAPYYTTSPSPCCRSSGSACCGASPPP